MLESNLKKIFVTGGAGYIGSHTCLELLNSGYEVVVYDNFSNGHAEALKRVEKLTSKTLEIIEGDMRDEKKIYWALKDAGCGAFIHFAGLKAVGDSVRLPLDYYENNVIWALSLLCAMKKAVVKMLALSSSANVYVTLQFYLS